MSAFPYIALLTTFFLTANMNGCEEQPNDNPTDPTEENVENIKVENNKYEYRFGDSSVPPQYHRSYTITITPNKAHIVVDSYGDVLADKTYDITKSDYEKTEKAFKEAGLRTCRMKENTGCTGGTSESVTAYKNDAQTFTGRVYHCGGEDSGNMCGDVSKFADVVKGLIPDLMTLLK